MGPTKIYTRHLPVQIAQNVCNLDWHGVSRDHVSTVRVLDTCEYGVYSF